MRGPRPTATSRSSASTRSPFSSDTTTPFSSCVTPENRTPILNSMPRRAERALELLADRLVLIGDQVRKRLDDGDLGAPAAPDAGELDADDATAENGDLLGHEIEGERLLGGDDAAADLEAGKRSRVRPGRQHDVLAGDGLVADLHGGGRGEAALALDRGDAAGLDQPLQTLVLAGDDLFAVRRDRRDVDAAERGGHAVLGGFARDVRDLGGVQQSLGGDAADVQAGPADLVLLDQTDRQAQFAGAQRGGVATASRSQDDKVKVLLGHRATPRYFTGESPKQGVAARARSARGPLP